MNLELRKCYIRHREGYPETEMQDYARRGFLSFGCEVVPFEGFGDIEQILDLGPEVGIAGYIGDIHQALKQINKPIPSNVDYPWQLVPYLKREVWDSTLEEVIKHPGKPIFIKPMEHKLFTGFVWDGDLSSMRRINGCPLSTQVWASDPIEILSEYRAFILDGEVLDCRRYKGAWNWAPSEIVIKNAIQAFGSYAPRAYCLDWGVTTKGTVLVEMNEGYAFGHYGLQPELYARMLSARWSEMTK